MDKDRRVNQVLYWVHEERNRIGRPGKNWMETVKSDLECLEISWKRVEELAMDRDEQRRSVARCADGLSTKYHNQFLKHAS